MNKNPSGQKNKKNDGDKPYNVNDEEEKDEGVTEKPENS